MDRIANFYFKKRHTLKESKQNIHYVNLYVENKDEEIKESSEKWSDEFVSEMERIYDGKIKEEKNIQKKSRLRRFLDLLKHNTITNFFWKIFDLFGDILKVVSKIFLGMYNVVSSVATRVLSKITDKLGFLNPVRFLKNAKSGILGIFGASLIDGKSVILRVLGSFSIGFLVGKFINGILNWGASKLAGKKTTIGELVYEVLHGDKQAEKDLDQEMNITRNIARQGKDENANEIYSRLESERNKLDTKKEELSKLRTEGYVSGKYTQEEFDLLEQTLKNDIAKTKENINLLDTELITIGLKKRKERGEDVSKILMDIQESRRYGDFNIFKRTQLGTVVYNKTLTENERKIAILNNALVNIGENSITKDDVDFSSDAQFEMGEFILKEFYDKEQGKILGFDVGIDDVFGTLISETNELKNFIDKNVNKDNNQSTINSNTSIGGSTFNSQSNLSSNVNSLNMEISSLNNNININDNKGLRSILIDETNKMKEDIKTLQGLNPNFKVNEQVNNIEMIKEQTWDEVSDIRRLMDTSNKQKISFNLTNIIDGTNNFLLNQMTNSLNIIPIIQPVDSYV